MRKSKFSPLQISKIIKEFKIQSAFISVNGMDISVYACAKLIKTDENELITLPDGFFPSKEFLDWHYIILFKK